MIGNQIYVIVCKGAGGHVTPQTFHATFDGAYERMQQIKEYWKEEKGMIVKEGLHGLIHVYYPGGQFYRDYWVYNRTIQK